MTTDQRKRLRMALENHGFNRISFTDASTADACTERYSETWVLKRTWKGSTPTDQVVITWAPKEEECGERPQRPIGHFTCGEHKGHKDDGKILHQRLGEGSWL